MASCLKKTSELITRPQVRSELGDGLLELGQSMLTKGQLQEILIKPDGTVIAGHRRVEAAKLVGIKELRCNVVEGDLAPSMYKIIQLTENIQRENLKPPDIAKACVELMELNPGWTKKELAAHLDKDPSMVTYYLSPSKAIPAAQEAFCAGKLTWQDIHAISISPEPEETLAVVLGGGSAQKHSRKARSASTPTVRTSAIKCPLPSGVVIRVTGDGISLDDFIEALGEASKLAKAALSKGLNASTAVKVWADMAAH